MCFQNYLIAKLNRNFYIVHYHLVSHHSKFQCVAVVTTYQNQRRNLYMYNKGVHKETIE